MSYNNNDKSDKYNIRSAFNGEQQTNPIMKGELWLAHGGQG